jgi:hypothetical protein
MRRRSLAASTAGAFALAAAFAISAACGSFGAADGVDSPDAALAADAAVLGEGSVAEAAAPGTYAAEVAADKPLAWYPLDDGEGSSMLRNASDPTRPATALSGVTLARPALVRGGGSAANFSGSPGSTSLALGNGFEFAGLAPYSLEVWINPSKIDPSFRRLFSNEVGIETPAWGGYGLSLQESSFVFSRITMNTQCNTSVVPPFAAGTTHHIVATFDGTSSRLFVDGVQVANKTCIAPSANDAGPLFVGSTAGAFSVFAGDMDEIAVYARALLPDRIRAHYAAGKL